MLAPAMTHRTTDRTTDRTGDTAINWTGLWFGLALAVLAAYQQLKLPPVLPILIHDYGFGRILAGGFISVYAACGLLLSLRLGAIMQRHGTAALLNLAFVLFAAAAGVMILWPAQGWLFLAARAVEGVAFAVLAIAGPAICTANGGRRGLAVSSALIATWIPAGALLANLMAVGLVERLGWRGLWWAGIAATAVMAAWTAAVRAKGTVRLGGVAAAGADAAPNPEKQRMMILTALLFMLWSMQLFAYFTWLPDYLVDAYGYSPQRAALLYTVPLTVLTGFNLAAAPILRAGVPVAVLLAASLAVQGAIWIALPHLGPYAAAVAAFGIFAAAAGITPTCLFALPGTIFGVDRAGGRAFGVMMTGRNLGVLCGPLTVGALVQAGGGWAGVPAALGALCVLSAAGALGLHLKLRRAGQSNLRPAGRR